MRKMTNEEFERCRNAAKAFISVLVTPRTNDVPCTLIITGLAMILAGTAEQREDITPLILSLVPLTDTLHKQLVTERAKDPIVS
jgi:hypothetical protein